MYTHLLLQATVPEAHDNVHLPAEQINPLGQMVPQPPQLLRSVLVLTHILLQRVKPVPHNNVQAPLTQVRPVAQDLLQAPQFRESVLVSTHIPELQRVGAVEGQTKVQAPLTHCRALEHWLAHLPQWLLSVCVLTQAPLQLVGVAEGQDVTHELLEQTSPDLQAFPHVPQ